MPAKILRLGPLFFAIEVNSRRLTFESAIRSRRWGKLHRLLAGDRGAKSVPASATSQTGSKTLNERLTEIRWQQAIDLGSGVVTPGRIDYRKSLDKFRYPDDMSGLRVLDIGTGDGFWAFAFERRGAAEVVATGPATVADTDVPPKARARMDEAALGRPLGAGFALASEILQSKVRLETLNPYRLDDGKPGTFDVVHAASQLCMMRNPVKLMQNIRGITKGYALIAESYEPDLDRYGGDCVMDYLGHEGGSAWWRFSRSALKKMVYDAGFDTVEILNDFAADHSRRGERQLVIKAS